MSKKCMKKTSGAVLAVMIVGVCMWTIFAPSNVLTFHDDMENNQLKFTDFQVVNQCQRQVIGTTQANLKEWLTTYNFPDSILEDKTSYC